MDHLSRIRMYAVGLIGVHQVDEYSEDASCDPVSMRNRDVYELMTCSHDSRTPYARG